MTSQLGKEEIRTMVREDGYEQLVDGVGIELDVNKVFKFKCCDCGLVHKMVIAHLDPLVTKVGFAIERVVE